MNAIFTDAELIHSLIVLLLLGSIGGFFAGVLLLLRPDWMLSLSKFSNRWISTDKLEQSLDQSFKIDRWFYRNGYLSGAVLLAGALYIVYIVTIRVDRDVLLLSFGRLHLVQTALLEPVVDTLVLLFLAGAVLAMIVSLFLIFRPSMLRDLELVADKSVSLQNLLLPLDVPRVDVDQLIFEHARVVGVLLLGASLYTWVVMAYWLSNNDTVFNLLINLL